MQEGVSKEKMIRVTLRLPQELYDALCVMATRLCISRSELVRRLLAKHVEKRKSQSLNKVLFEDLMIGDGIVSILWKQGKIICLDSCEDNWVEIRWEDGTQSGWYHPHWDDRILYIGR